MAKEKKKKLLSATLNPGGHLGAGITIRPGGKKGMSAEANALNPEDAMAITTKVNAVIAKAVAEAKKPKPKKAEEPGEESPGTEVPTEPGEPPTEPVTPPIEPPGPEHGGIMHEFTNSSGGKTTYFNDGTYRITDGEGNVVTERYYPDGFPSDKRVKNLLGGVTSRFSG